MYDAHKRLLLSAASQVLKAGLVQFLRGQALVQTDMMTLPQVSA